jgi:hypothetical protein
MSARSRPCAPSAAGRPGLAARGTGPPDRPIGRTGVIRMARAGHQDKKDRPQELRPTQARAADRRDQTASAANSRRIGFRLVPARLALHEDRTPIRLQPGGVRAGDPPRARLDHVLEPIELRRVRIVAGLQPPVPFLAERDVVAEPPLARAKLRGDDLLVKHRRPQDPPSAPLQGHGVTPGTEVVSSLDRPSTSRYHPGPVCPAQLQLTRTIEALIVKRSK